MSQFTDETFHAFFLKNDLIDKFKLELYVKLGKLFDILILIFILIGNDQKLINDVKLLMNLILVVVNLQFKSLDILID
jgi:hypothetical protein